MLSRETLERIASGEISIATAALVADSAPPPRKSKYRKVLVKKSGGRRFNAGRKPKLDRESHDPLLDLCRLWREAIDAGHADSAAALEKRMLELQAAEARCRIVRRERIPADVLRARRALFDDPIHSPRYVDVDSLI